MKPTRPERLDRRTPSTRLRDLVPLDRRRMVELLTDPASRSDSDLGRVYPWMSVSSAVLGIDLAQGVGDGRWDCFCVDLAPDPTVDPDPILASIYAALPEGGALVASLSNGHASTSLAAAGFVDVHIAKPGMFPFNGGRSDPARRRPPVHVRGWKRSSQRSELERVDELSQFIYDALVPGYPSFSDDALAILGRGKGLCGDYNVALGEALRREGFHVGFVSMLAEDHPGGRGGRMIDTHEVLEITLADGSRHVIDPTANVRFSSSFSRLISEPSLADIDRVRDERYQSREYELYTTSFWYSRVVKADIRVSHGDPLFWRPVKSLRQPTRWSELMWAPRPRPVRRLARLAVRRLRTRPRQKEGV